MKIDFTVPVIDNYGDMGFALMLALSLLKKHPEISIAFYSENKELFEKMLGSYFEPGLEYQELSTYDVSQKSSIRLNFFAYPLQEAEISQTIINIDYLQFHRAKSSFEPGLESLHNTYYPLGNSIVHHIVPSPLPEGGGIVFPWFFLPEKQTKKYDLSIFCYTNTISSIKQALTYFEPGLEIQDFSEGKNFISQKDFLSTLASSEKCIVRGENSLILAMCLGKPFLWDPYIEKNNAHLEKITDLCEFLESYFEPELIKCIRTFAENTNDQERILACKTFLETHWDRSWIESLKQTLESHLLLTTIEKILYKNLQ